MYNTTMAPPAPPPTLKPLPTLLETTKKLLEKCPLNSYQLAEKAGLKYFWVRKFRAGHISNPGINRLQTLFNFLASQQTHD